MERCPICGGLFRDKERICLACGYDASADWTRYPTLNRSGKMLCRRHIAPTPVEKKTDSLYFQNEQENSSQKDPDVWMNLWSSTGARTPVQSKTLEQKGWDFDTLLKVMHQHP